MVSNEMHLHNFEWSKVFKKFEAGAQVVYCEEDGRMLQISVVDRKSSFCQIRLIKETLKEKRKMPWSSSIFVLLGSAVAADLISDSRLFLV